MATGQTLLNLMEVLDQELQLQPAESDVVRGLVALNAAQDYFEALAASRAGLFGDSTGTIVTVSGTETTTFPSTCDRIDSLWKLNSQSKREYRVLPGQQSGGGVQNSFPYALVDGTGAPRQYWTKGQTIYWSPVPDAVYTLRWFGFSPASDITANGTFAYRNVVMLPLAAFAVKLMKSGLDDAAGAQSGLAEQAFTPVLDTLELINRDRAKGLDYTRVNVE